MRAPIYSNSKESDIAEETKIRIIKILSNDTIQELNEYVTFVEHGIYVFLQYKEKPYIINGFAEDIFWKIVSKLYILFHDSGSNILLFFLEIVPDDGKKSIKPFPVTSPKEVMSLEKAKEFINYINILRQTEQHNMKPDSVIDNSKENKRIKLFKKIIKKDIPESEKEWEKCIMWINQNCNNLYNALKRRLECLERETDPSKKELLLIGYYGCLEKYFQSNMYDLLMEISRRKRKNSQEMYIRALVKKQGDKMSNEIIELLKKSKRKVDPYKVALQVVDNYIR